MNFFKESRLAFKDRVCSHAVPGIIRDTALDKLHGVLEKKRYF